MTIIILVNINDSSGHTSYYIHMTAYQHLAYNLLLCIKFLSLEFKLVSTQEETLNYL